MISNYVDTHLKTIYIYIQLYIHIIILISKSMQAFWNRSKYYCFIWAVWPINFLCFFKHICSTISSPLSQWEDRWHWGALSLEDNTTWITAGDASCRRYWAEFLDVLFPPKWSAITIISYTLSREYWVVSNQYSRLLFTSEDCLCTCKNNRWIWHHNASISRSWDVTDQLWWRHNAKAEKTFPGHVGDNGKLNDQRSILAELCVQDIKQRVRNKMIHSLPWITIFWSLMRWFANDFHSWLRHSWKSLANHLTRDQKIIIHGNSCIILYIQGSFQYMIRHLIIRSHKVLKVYI